MGVIAFEVISKNRETCSISDGEQIKTQHNLGAIYSRFKAYIESEMAAILIQQSDT